MASHDMFTTPHWSDVMSVITGLLSLNVTPDADAL